MLNKLPLIFLMMLLFNSLQSQTLLLNTFFTETQKTDAINQKITARMYVKYNVKKENTDLKIEVPVIPNLDIPVSDYEIIADERFFIPYKMEKGADLIFFQILQSYSKLTGMKYYSRSSGEVETFIKEAYSINAKDKKTRISDFKPETVETHTTRFFVEQDNKFGKLAYQSDIYAAANQFIVITRCLDSLSGVNNPGETITLQIYIYDESSQGIFGYSGSFIRIRNEMLLKMGFFRPTTFSNRLRATTVHLAGAMGHDWTAKLNPWDEKKLKDGAYKNF